MEMGVHKTNGQMGKPIQGVSKKLQLLKNGCSKY
jgi:hypothetical protein